MPRALRVCSCIGCDAHPGSCPELATGGRCARCKLVAERRRGTSTQRGYGRAHRHRFRPGVLRRDPLCTCTDQTRTATHHHSGQCLSPSTVADHHPRDKRELRRLGLDEHDPNCGRGLCKVCHDHHTATTQPGGFQLR